MKIGDTARASTTVDATSAASVNPTDTYSITRCARPGMTRSSIVVTA